MARVKRGVVAGRRHKKILKKAKGYFNARRKVFRTAKQAVIKAGQYAYRGRREKKREFRALWITRINAASRLCGMTYSTLIDGLNKAGLAIDRKVLADLAVHDMPAFTAIAEKAKASLAAEAIEDRRAHGRHRRFQRWSMPSARDYRQALAESLRRALTRCACGCLGKKGLLTEQLKGLGDALRRGASRRGSAHQRCEGRRFMAALEMHRIRLEQAAMAARAGQGHHRCDLAGPRSGAGQPASGHAHAVAHRADLLRRRDSRWPRAGGRGRLP